MSKSDLQQLSEAIKDAVSTTNSDGAISAGHHNSINSGSFSEIDAEIMSYFRRLPFEEKIDVLSYMISTHNRKEITS